ncbi:unnamed protein product [Urochloa humidicola]
MATMTHIAIPGHGVHYLKPNASSFLKPASSFATRRDAAAFRRSIMNRRCRSSSTTTSMGQLLAPEKLEVLAHLEPWAEAHVLPLLKPFDAAWQPSDFLPDAADADSFHAACRDIRARAAAVPDAILVCLVGNMVTEEALPTYQCVPNRFEGGVRDLTGADATAWARWIRGWSAEENRHGDVLSRYLLLSGRVDMRRVDATVHRLIAAGMDAMGAAAAACCPYHGFIYVAFQERATAISHGNNGDEARSRGSAARSRRTRRGTRRRTRGSSGSCSRSSPTPPCGRWGT